MAQALSERAGGLTVWARRPQTIESIEGLFPFHAADSVASLGEVCDVVAICVDRDSDVEQLLVDQGLLAAMKPGTVIVNHGTGSPAAARRFASLSQGRVDILDAPVSGGGEKARRRTLTMMVGGSRPAFDRCMGLFESCASIVRYLGGAGSGQLAKLINNALLAMNMWSVEEILAVAKGMGLGVESLTEILLASSGSSVALEQLTGTSADLLLHYREMLGKDVSEFETVVASFDLPSTNTVEVARQGVDGIPSAIALLGRTAHGANLAVSANRGN